MVRCDGHDAETNKVVHLGKKSQPCLVLGYTTVYKNTHTNQRYVHGYRRGNRYLKKKHAHAHTHRKKSPARGGASCSTSKGRATTNIHDPAVRPWEGTASTINSAISPSRKADQPPLLTRTPAARFRRYAQKQINTHRIAHVSPRASAICPNSFGKETNR